MGDNDMADILIKLGVSAKGYDKLLLIPNMTVSPSRSPNIPPAPTRVCTDIWFPAVREEGVLYPPTFQSFFFPLPYRTPNSSYPRK